MKKTPALNLLVKVTVIIPLVILALAAPSITMAQLTLQLPLGLSQNETVIPSNNRLTQDKVDLGKALFFDKRLSIDNTVSCATCHQAENAFTDGLRVSTGILNRQGTRNAPTVINRVFSTLQFHDGRAATLEAQATQPITNSVEMGMPNLTTVVNKLNGISRYRSQFQKAFGSNATVVNLQRALASFQRTLVSGNSPFDKFQAGDTSALNTSEQRGMNLFFGQARCVRCHSGSNLTDEGFHNLGVGINRPNPDLGRMNVTNNPGNRGQFKTPTVREISKTAPYMHDGSLATLADVVNFYNNGGTANSNLSRRITPLRLSAQQRQDLVNFLGALEGEGWQTTAPGVNIAPIIQLLLLD